MRRERELLPFWETDPSDVEEHDYEEYEALFLAAHLHAFDEQASEGMIRYYLQRYFRFHVVPPWVRRYVREVHGGEAIENIGDAPIDPIIDLSRAVRTLRALMLLDGTFARSGSDGWLDA